MPLRIRRATGADAAGMAAIYGPIVRSSATSFELEPPSVEELAGRVRAIGDAYPWIVLEEDGAVTAYAYASNFRGRPAYRWTVETTVYVHADQYRRGIGRAVMRALLDALEFLGYRRVVAGITLPNAGSVGLHEALGFVHVGAFHRCGYKHGAWHDVGFWQLSLGDDGPPTAEPSPLDALWTSVAWREASERALRAVR